MSSTPRARSSSATGSTTTDASANSSAGNVVPVGPGNRYRTASPHRMLAAPQPDRQRQARQV